MSTMLCRRYESAHRNDVHQLLVSLSRHYYVGGDGNLKFQKKPFEFSFDTVRQSSKKLMVSYLLRDHYSGVYYAESTTHDRLLNLGGFLFRAWAQKPGFDFCGVPLVLVVPQLVIDQWPRLGDLLEYCGVTSVKPRSGFETGMIDMKNWQREFFQNCYVDYRSGSGLELSYQFEYLRSKQLELCIRAAERTIGREKRTKLDKWRSSDAELLVPKDREDFERYFAPGEKSSKL